MLAGCPGKKPNTAKPGGADNRATSELPVVADNTGLPMRLLLPEGAHGEEELDLLAPNLSADSVNWSTQFHYHDSFAKVVESFDAQLKPQKFMRLSGPTLDKDVPFNPDSTAKPTSAMGKKAWISADRRIMAILDYIYTRGEDGAPDQHAYQLRVVKTVKPGEVKEPNKVVELP